METIKEEDDNELKMYERESIQLKQNLQLEQLKDDDEQNKRESSDNKNESDLLRESKTYQESFRFTKLNESLLNAVATYQEQNEELNNIENNSNEQNNENKIETTENNITNEIKTEENNITITSKVEKERIKEYKIVLLGDFDVGKTSILYRYMHNKFKKDIQMESQNPEHFQKVIQIDENLKIKLDIWDTAGMEKSGKIFKQYYKDIYGALIIFDLTKKESFNNAKNWLEELKENSPKDVVFCFLGNKSDLVNDREIPYEEIKEYTNDNLYYEVSAKTGNNISLAFESLAYNIQEKQIEEENNPDKVIRGIEGRKTTDLKEYNEKELKKKRPCC
jgi:small GTP-binding protein